MKENIVVKAREGDKSAEQEMFQFLLTRFTFLAQRRIHSEEARDIAQDACLTILKKYRTDAPRERFLPWAYGVLRSKIGNYYQHQVVHRRVMKNTPVAVESCLPSVVASDPEKQRRLIVCMKKLIKSYPKFARVLNLVYQGYTTAEICERLDVIPGNLYVILGRARRLLNTCLCEGGKL
jgi:RNA polymerase sigma factor (sigma-70 family)